MTVFLPPSFYAMNSGKRARRTATSVMAGYCDPRPTRDVLTCLLNGVPPYLEEDKVDESKVNTQLQRRKKKEHAEAKRERDKLRRREERARDKEAKEKRERMTQSTESISAPPAPSTSNTIVIKPSTPTASASFCFRPNIQLPTHHRPRSLTPPPVSCPPLRLLSHESTPDPSISSSTSRTSSKRPRTPDDNDFDMLDMSMDAEDLRPRKKRVAVKKGWKGWVEGSPPPSEKLINLDAVPILHERRTRSGKNFDAIGVGKDGWV